PNKFLDSTVPSPLPLRQARLDFRQHSKISSVCSNDTNVQSMISNKRSIITNYRSMITYYRSMITYYRSMITNVCEKEWLLCQALYRQNRRAATSPIRF
ncbi:MAG: hypothetical protein VKL39_08745, partial [Leptolyngbyaceae bacterium]|nr:hypothetical protein [Leptolyngbyaceae bacterium]